MLVTGAAGFIGSHLCEELLDQGCQVRGVDCFTDVYAPELKKSNVARMERHPNFDFVAGDLSEMELSPLFDNTDVVFHLAAVPGVRLSWVAFSSYVQNNILASQRLLEEAKNHPDVRFVYASSSSVYGNTALYPCREADVKRPHSPYGVSKLAVEHLCEAYVDAFGVHAVSLRYFSVYGPRQRPDMGVHRLIETALGRRSFTVFGDGEQVRDMTYVGDIVRATISAASAGIEPGSVYNIAGGSDVSLNTLIALVGQLTNTGIPFRRDPAQPGDVWRTGGDTERAQRHLGWSPQVSLEEGLVRQVEWHVSWGGPTE